MSDVKEFKTCPICGHHGWCGWSRSRNPQTPDAILYCCHYQDGNKGDLVVGQDGVTYVMVKENSEGDGWVLVTKEQDEENQRKWRESRGLFPVFSKCPICGSENTCTSFSPKESPDTTLYMCKGICNGKKGAIVAGKNGTRYHIIKQAKNGDWMLETEEQRKASRQKWKEEHAYGVTRRDRSGNDASGAYEAVNAYKTAYMKSAAPAKENPKEEPVATTRIVTPERVIRENPEISRQSRIVYDERLLPNEKLDRVYRTLIDMLTLLPEHREKLHADGWTDEWIQKYHIVSLPMTDKARWELEHSGEKQHPGSILPWRWQIVKKLQSVFGEDLSGIPGFYRAKTADRETGEIIYKWRMAGASGMMFFSQDCKGHIFGAQIRVDKNVTGKYLAWSTDPMRTNDNGVQLYPDGTKLFDQAGIFYEPEHDTSYVAYVTEGVKKAAIGHEFKHCPFIPLTGVGKVSLLFENRDSSLIMADYLKSIGTKMIIFAFDSDKIKNEKVLKSEQKAVALAKEYGFKVGVADWTMYASYCKGLDDLLIKGLDCLYEER